MFTQSMYFRVSVILHFVQDDKILWVNCYIVTENKKERDTLSFSLCA